MLDESIAELKPKQAPKPAPSQPSPPSEPEKWSRENHPAFKKTTQPQAPEEKEETTVTYRVNDMVQAKWLTGDKGFYPARITSVTGSSTAPIYIVKFKGYDNTETVRARDVRPLSNKRKADSQATAGPSSASSATAQPAPGLVSSAGATMYPEAKNTPADGADPSKPPKAKKIKAKKELERGKSKWQEFTSKSKFAKGPKKDSMFRTPDGIHGRGKLLRRSKRKSFYGLIVLQLVLPVRDKQCERTQPAAVTYMR